MAPEVPERRLVGIIPYGYHIQRIIHYIYLLVLHRLPENRRKTMIHRAHVIGLATAGLMGSVAQADDWPQRPVTLVVPFQAGGITDIVARRLEPGISEQLGQSVVVTNIGGHSSVGTRRVVDAEPDGYEFLVHELGIMTAEASGVQDFGYRDLEPVAAVTEICLVAVVRADSGWRTVADIGAARGDDPVIAGVTIGGASHVAAALVAELGGFSIRPVQVGGSSAAYAALIGGQIDMMLAAPAGAASYFYDGEGNLQQNPEAAPVLYMGEERHPRLPDIQSMADAGSDTQLCIPHLVFAPAGTPTEIVDEMASAIEHAYHMPDGLISFFAGAGGVELFLSGDALNDYLDNSWELIQPLAAAAADN